MKCTVLVILASVLALCRASPLAENTDVPEGGSLHVPFAYHQEFMAADAAPGTPYTYDTNDDVLGPHMWGANYPTCAGSYQSPINIQSIYCTTNASSLHLVNSDKAPTAVRIENNGYSIAFDFTYDGQRPYLTGAALNGDNYVFESMHMHWGQNLLGGSEHKINGLGSELELHLIHRNTKYLSLAEAAAHADGLTVLGLMKSSFLLTPSQDMFQNMTNVAVAMTAANLDSSPSGFSMRDIIGSSTFENVYKYPGSLTTPPCNQAVTWLVATTTKFISISDMLNIRAIKNLDNNSMGPNYRPVQTGANAMGGSECQTLSISL